MTLMAIVLTRNSAKSCIKLTYQKVPKSQSTFVEKKINLNTNQFTLGIGPFSAIFFIVSRVFNYENSNLVLLPTQKVPMCRSILGDVE